MIKTGKGKLEWERKIPEDQINDLKVMLEADNFNDNLPAVKKFLTYVQKIENAVFSVSLKIFQF